MSKVSSVSRRFRTLSIRKMLHSSQIYLLRSMSSVSRRFCMLSIRKTLHSNQIYLLQSMPYAEHTENSVPYPGFFCVVSHISKAFWPPISLFWLTITAIPECFLIHFPLRHLESQTPCDLFWRLSPSASFKRKSSKTVAKLSELAPTQPGPIKSPPELSSLTHRNLY